MHNLNFYDFMHKQLLVLIALFVGTGGGYIYIGFLYSSIFLSVVWYTMILLVSAWGIWLYKSYKSGSLNLEAKERWLYQSKFFLFTYFTLWTVIFILNVSRDNIELHYIALVTQFGAAVVSSAILVSQRRLAVYTVVSLMIPIIIYFIVVGEFYSYLLAFFTFVLTGVLLYAANNTYNYLVKSQLQSYTDYLTRLGNRRYFIELLEDSLEVQKENGTYLYLLLIDLDYFKTINDTLGHDIGDELLIEASRRMKEVIQINGGTISRLGGDEFCVLSDFYETSEECHKSAMIISKELLRVIKTNYSIDEHTLYISASIGMSLVYNPTMKASTFIKEADIAMYEAKAKGRDGVIIFSDELSQQVEKKLEIERELHFAITKGELSLRYQPQINLKTSKIGCEVLVRWKSNKSGYIGPDEFIPIAEQTGIIVELGHFILEESFKSLSEWEREGIDIHQMSINISVRQLFDSNFITDVKKLCEKYLNKRLQRKLMFEITETSTAEDIDLLSESIESLNELGIRFSMDDFGTGYSSLSLLSKISIDELKIDKSFIDDIGKSEEGLNMIKTILSLAKNFNMLVVAEGVEEKFQKEFLEKQNCDIIQGYYFSKPLLRSEFESYFLQNKA